MLNGLGDRQQALVRALKRQPQGMTMDGLADVLGITRTAVRQHLISLERDGYVTPGELLPTDGRPVRAYRLTATGEELFPKQYAWLSGLLLGRLIQEQGGEQVAAFLRELAVETAQPLLARTRGADALQATADLMQGLGFEATAEGDAITATNCVYLDLARQYPEVCEFDRALLAELTGRAVVQPECLVKGGQVCCFQFGPPGPSTNGHK